ncbi:MAG: hypothetical protein ACOC5T_05085 [Elusimicrobiota bacterium]
MIKRQQVSIVDFFFNQLRDKNLDQTNQIINRGKKYISPKIANKLYSIWRNERNVVSKQVYKIPRDIDKKDIEEMVSAGLVQKRGDSIKITGKGSSIIKTMILGNDKSTFDKHGSDIDYLTAQSNINAKSKKTEDNWWNRFLGD